MRVRFVGEWFNHICRNDVQRHPKHCEQRNGSERDRNSELFLLNSNVAGKRSVGGDEHRPPAHQKNETKVTNTGARFHKRLKHRLLRIAAGLEMLLQPVLTSDERPHLQSSCLCNTLLPFFALAHTGHV